MFSDRWGCEVCEASTIRGAAAGTACGVEGGDDMIWQSVDGMAVGAVGGGGAGGRAAGLAIEARSVAGGATCAESGGKALHVVRGGRALVERAEWCCACKCEYGAVEGTPVQSEV